MRQVYGTKVTRLTLGDLLPCLVLPASRGVGMGLQKSAEAEVAEPIGEGLNLFEALQYHGVDSELVIFPDENHWVLKPANSILWYHTVMGWLDDHLKK